MFPNYRNSFKVDDIFFTFAREIWTVYKIMALKKRRQHRPSAASSKLLPAGHIWPAKLFYTALVVYQK
jgi:hypothetical protein